MCSYYLDLLNEQEILIKKEKVKQKKKIGKSLDDKQLLIEVLQENTRLRKLIKELQEINCLIAGKVDKC